MATARYPADAARHDHYGQTLTDPFGLPLCPRTSTKLSFKNSVGCWEDRGFNPHSEL